jgi:L-Ala-D/L-Glu epimerase
MKSMHIGPLSLQATVEQWPLKRPFRITGKTWDVLDTILVSLEHENGRGHGEAAGVYFLGETTTSMINQIEAVRASIEAGVGRDDLLRLLPAGGARNALDCALWDLESKISGRPAWELAGLSNPRPLLTTFGCGADTPEAMATVAKGYAQARAIKLKLTGESIDAERVATVRNARPDVWLGVDANQGFTRASLERLMPVLIEARVALIEQPFPIGEEVLLDGFQSPIPIAADESLQDARELPALARRFDVVNVKLDKAGGLTETLSIARQARELGLDLMVGNMIGTSLAMAPACLVGQLCAVVDLDGPIFLQKDRPDAVSYASGMITCAGMQWGMN